MNLFEELRTVALKQSEVGEFPTWLMADVMIIASDPEQYAYKADLVETLITQIINYDPYAGAGCFDTSVGAEAVRATIRKIMHR